MQEVSSQEALPSMVRVGSGPAKTSKGEGTTDNIDTIIEPVGTCVLGRVIALVARTPADAKLNQCRIYRGRVSRM